MISFLLRIAILLVVALVYAILDVFNKRNVPDIFVYACLILAVVVTLTYNASTIAMSLLIAVIIGAIGYILYRKGVMGAGDFFEFATISLLIPIQPPALLSSLPQFGFPFIFSVFIGTGYAAVVGMTGYYLLRAYRHGALKSSEVERGKLYQGLVIFVAYMLLLAFISYLTGIRLIAIALVLIIGVASSLTIIFERSINKQMVSYVYPSKLTQEDMIATNFMSKDEIAFFSKKSKHFGRLVTRNLIRDIKGVRKKVPLYTSGVPLALFAFIGIALSLLFGNIILYILI